MSDVTESGLENSSENIETILAKFQNLLNSEHNIPEISPEINSLTEQIEGYFKINKSSGPVAESATQVGDDSGSQVEDESATDSSLDESNQHNSTEPKAQQDETTLHEYWQRLSRKYRRKRRQYYEERNKDLHKNLEKRTALIESFKSLLTVEENITHTLKTFKALQEEWYAAGPIPKNDYEMVWQTYRHHVENFYDYLDLNREFRDLDFKYNFDQKKRLIEQAQQLAGLEDQTLAFKELQKLHKIWKEDVGPVAKEHREPLWEAFSAATKIIHDKRQAFFDQRDAQQKENLSRKQAIIQEIKAHTTQDNQEQKSWQKSMSQVQKLRDEFFELGPVPKKHNKSLWSEFKETTRKYNELKNAFFKNQKKEYMANLRAKRELIRIAEQHLDTDDFQKSTPVMKKIQADWRNIGPVPFRDSDKIWKQFKSICNAYFDKLNNEHKLENEAEQKALNQKNALLKSLENQKAGSIQNMDALTELIKKWREAGKISAKHKTLETAFFQSIERYLTHMGMTKQEAALTSFTYKIECFAAQDQNELLHKQGSIVEQKIKELKTEINQLENNLGFFQNVSQDSPLLKEVHDNIALHRSDLHLWLEKKEVLKRL